MSHSESRWPLDQAQHLRDALRETGLPDSEVEKLTTTFADLAACVRAHLGWPCRRARRGRRGCLFVEPACAIGQCC